jgi:glutathione S-transferase
MNDAETYQLFKTDLCGFCYRVRGFLSEHNIEVPLRDINTEPDAFRELMQGAGRATVPCLRIERGDEVQWMFESMDIMTYLAAQNGVS